jgi:hypothetical protein
MAQRDVVLLGSQAALLQLAQERRDREVSMAHSKFASTIAPILEECQIPSGVDLSWTRNDDGSIVLSAQQPDISPKGL